MIRNLILSAALLLLSVSVYAQRGHTVTARLLDESSGEPVAYATVSQLNPNRWGRLVDISTMIRAVA